MIPLLIIISLLLAVIVILLLVMLPEEKRDDLFHHTKTLFWIVIFFAIAAGIVLLVWGFVSDPHGMLVFIREIPWYGYVGAVAAIIVFAVYRDVQHNKRIRAGDELAIEERIQYLMKEHKYSREKAVEAVERIRNRKKK